MAVPALKSAVVMRGDVAGCIIQSDRGSQFRSGKCLRSTNLQRVVGSMGRLGAAGDRDTMARFFSLQHSDVLGLHS